MGVQLEKPLLKLNTVKVETECGSNSTGTARTAAFQAVHRHMYNFRLDTKVGSNSTLTQTYDSAEKLVKGLLLFIQLKT